jgi:hypothetical protein
MIAAARVTGQPPPVTVADGGYYSGASLQQCTEAGYRVVVPSSRPRKARDDPFAKERFRYDAETHTYTCPQGTVLTERGTKAGRGGGTLTVYRADPQVCRSCAAFGRCTTDQRHGRSITRTATEAVLQRHHDWMASDEAQRLSRLRKSLIEPVFGLITDGQDGRRTRVRGLDKVQAEWRLQAVAFNLRTLARVWAGQLAAAMTATAMVGA